MDEGTLSQKQEYCLQAAKWVNGFSRIQPYSLNVLANQILPKRVKCKSTAWETEAAMNQGWRTDRSMSQPQSPHLGGTGCEQLGRWPDTLLSSHPVLGATGCSVLTKPSPPIRTGGETAEQGTVLPAGWSFVSDFFNTGWRLALLSGLFTDLGTLAHISVFVLF